MVDTENKIILTGGSKPTCHGSGLFSGVIKIITHLRIGEEFGHIIDKCSEEFMDHVKKATRSAGLEDKKQLSELTISQIEKLNVYKEIVSENKSTWHDRIPSSTEPKRILSWACDGSTFTFKPPCLRCQRFYSSWMLHQMPRDKTDRKDSLVQDLFSHLVPRNHSKDINFAYCAETVAASKLHLLRNGTLALV